MTKESGRWPEDGRRRVVVAAVRPSVDAGRHAVKRTVGDTLRIDADLLIDGHDQLAARLHYRFVGAARPGRDVAEPPWIELPMARRSPHDIDRWSAEIVLDRLGAWQYLVEGWVDAFATWRHGLHRKVDARQDVSVELVGGAALVAAAAARAKTGTSDDSRRDDARFLAAAARALGDAEAPASARITAALDDELALRIARYPDRSLATRQDEPQTVVVEPERARFSAWYEFFPRSVGSGGPGGRHGTLRTAAGMLPYIAEMGFDVIYLPPIHPIGRSHRKGPNNSLTAGPDDHGSPWAIGGPEGGHEALHPALGTLEDFAAFVDQARALGIETAIDIAFQASPDHPWVREHPDWFVRRPDGTIQYAENPPKKYQDVYPFDFQCDDWRGLWRALADVFLVWAKRGVRTFRVDNPHTKPIPFWEWCIADVRRHYPDTVFLSEAFTRPLMLQRLAKIGFSQSYTYFTWRTTSRELRAYLEDLVGTEQLEYLRPNFWPNTPDIQPEHLQTGGRPMFVQRAILAATLTASYGIYGPAYELCDASAIPGKEEYADSEKYQLKRWDLDAPHSLRYLFARLNRARREHLALQDNRTLRFHDTDDPALLCYSKTARVATAGGEASSDVIVCVVNLDPHHVRRGHVTLDLAALGLPADAEYQVHDLIGDARFAWRGARNYVELDPAAMPAHVFALRHRSRSEHGFEYFL
jgi:starch synthase (maltosyl-transferring)